MIDWCRYKKPGSLTTASIEIKYQDSRSTNQASRSADGAVRFRLIDETPFTFERHLPLQLRLATALARGTCTQVQRAQVIMSTK